MRLKHLKAAAVLCSLMTPLMAAATISVSAPEGNTIVVGKSRQYTASVSGLMDATVSWAVNGVAGGNTSVGTVTGAGVYTAPAALPATNPVTLTATSVMDTSVAGSIKINIKTPAPVVTKITPATVSTGTFTVTVNGSGFAAGAVVLFGTRILTPSAISASSLVVSGPATTTGSVPLMVMNPTSQPSTPLYVTVYAGNGNGSGTLSIAPAGAAVPLTYTQQFGAILSGATTTATWAVNGVVGGNTSVGTITSTGLYTAPAAMPASPTVNISAIAPNTATASVVVTLLSNTPPQISSVSVAAIPLGVYSFVVTGTGFTASTSATLGGMPLAVTYSSQTQISVAGFTKTGGPQSLVVSNGPIASAPYAMQVGVANPQVSPTAARRFLQQAAFGPTANDAARVQQLGFDAWLNEQFAMTPVSNYAVASNQGGMGGIFFANAVTNADQLRQRMAFTLHQIFVTSLNKLVFNENIVPFEELLLADAFANFRQTMEDVTLNPSMANYLDMANSSKANPSGTVLPNENYARELLQLFTIGTAYLNNDGTVMTDVNNLPVATYTQADIAEFAKVFTGWSYAPATPGGTAYFGMYIQPKGTLISYPAYHDMSQKTLLAYTPGGAPYVLPGGGSPQADLQAALDHIFHHPNVGPFIGKQLIQHLVKSNPSPAYVQAVADAFNDNGQGVRGDMRAVIKAVLLHPEARANDNAAPHSDDGHLQEPALYLAGVYRALGATMTVQNTAQTDSSYMGQNVFYSPSVFNYYSPNYAVAGTGLAGGEFQIYNPYTAIYRANTIAGMVNSYSNTVLPIYGATVDVAPLVPLASNPATLVDALDLTLMCGQMPASMKSTLVTALQAETGGNLRRVEDGLYLILTSGYYNVWN